MFNIFTCRFHYVISSMKLKKYLLCEFSETRVNLVENSAWHKEKNIETFFQLKEWNISMNIRAISVQIKICSVQNQHIRKV